MREILDNQEILSKHKNNEECKLKENWSYSLGSEAVITKVVDVSTRLSNVIENKENILETLRNPIADNSIPWTKERQGDLVESFNYLVSNSLTINCVVVGSIPHVLATVICHRFYGIQKLYLKFSETFVRK